MGRSPIGTTAMSSTERSRRRRAALRGDAPERQSGASAEQARELERAGARIAELEAELATAKDEALAQAQAFRDEWARRAAKPKAEKAPLPPDEERDRQIKALKTANQNLRRKNIFLTQYYDDAIALVGGMPFATQSAIAKCLHPDHTPSEAERADACRLFNAWKADKDKAKRGTR